MATFFIAIGLHAFVFFNAITILALYSGRQLVEEELPEVEPKKVLMHSEESVNDFIDELEVGIEDLGDDDAGDGDAVTADVDTGDPS